MIFGRPVKMERGLLLAQSAAFTAYSIVILSTLHDGCLTGRRSQIGAGVYSPVASNNDHA